MAYISEDMRLMGGVPGQQLFIYSTEDNAATVAEAGYFDQAAEGLQSRDRRHRHRLHRRGPGRGHRPDGRRRNGRHDHRDHRLANIAKVERRGLAPASTRASFGRPL